MPTRTSLLFLFLIVVIASPLHAQTGGCTDSPEAPTLALAIVGGIGVLVSRTRLGRRK